MLRKIITLEEIKFKRSSIKEWKYEKISFDHNEYRLYYREKNSLYDFVAIHFINLEIDPIIVFYGSTIEQVINEHPIIHHLSIINDKLSEEELFLHNHLGEFSLIQLDLLTTGLFALKELTKIKELNFIAEV